MSEIKIYVEPQDGKTWENICEEVDNGKTKRVMFRGVEFVKAKHGHWIINPQYGAECSECGLAMFAIMGVPYTSFKPNYCPLCGAKMDEVKDDSNR